ncbi:hypothetical protein [Piscinibacter sp. HJYY11]|uniref:helix-turn-helix transcriptional regulator n=1 Tax=Piscinibacter sp. HJYY11 TaxID=2801333 RepID=UPI00191D503B|nr:hypothetical protein [Piscinibacter sp. HJYY11]MBL0728854.1 hypothetical protein [Piscinibacter sp. HJYY11]
MPIDADLQWLHLLDQLYALVETEGSDAALAGVVDQWPEAWRPLVQCWAARIGAGSIQIAAPWALPSTRQSPGREAGLLSHRRITGHLIWARSLAPEGFTADQAREFQLLCSHLHTAWALRSSLDAAQASLAALHEVVDAMPLSIVVLDEHGEVVLLNRHGQAWLARTARACLQGRRLHLLAQHAVFERALQGFMANPARPQRLQLEGLDLHLKQLACPTLSVLLLVHERCDPARLREISSPPAALVQQMQGRFALTDKELPLAWNLAQGMPLKQYAALSGRSIETLRSQLKSVFRKLGAADQKGLGRVVFEALHAVMLQALGDGLATLVAARPPASFQHHRVEHLTWP